MSFRTELEQLINRHSRENLSNTPDFVLAEYVESCLYVFEKAIAGRDNFYGFSPASGQMGRGR